MSGKASHHLCEICYCCCSNKSFFFFFFKTCGLLASGSNPKLLQNSRIVWVGNQHALCSDIARVQVAHSGLDIPVSSQGLSELFAILFLVKPNCQSPNLSACWRGLPASTFIPVLLRAAANASVAVCINGWSPSVRWCSGTSLGTPRVWHFSITYRSASSQHPRGAELLPRPTPSPACP